MFVGAMQQRAGRARCTVAHFCYTRVQKCYKYIFIKISNLYLEMYVVNFPVCENSKLKPFKGHCWPFTCVFFLSCFLSFFLLRLAVFYIVAVFLAFNLLPFWLRVQIASNFLQLFQFLHFFYNSSTLPRWFICRTQMIWDSKMVIENI